MTDRARGRHRVAVENEMIRRRERETMHQQMWGGASKYYDHFNKVNTKYEEWTSPRYYEDNTKLIADIKNKREKETILEQRREKLRQKLEAEDKAYEIEVMVNKNKLVQEKPIVNKLDCVDMSVLKDINDTFKLAQETKRRHEAETRLYNQWRMNNPSVRSYERSCSNRNMKMSWLDQQIEKRMKRDKEEQDAKRTLKEREERLKRDIQKDEEEKLIKEDRNKVLMELLDEQVKELKLKQQEADRLKEREHEEMKKRNNLLFIEEQQKEEEKRRLERECALFNIRQHKLKLKQKAVDVQENLVKERELLGRLKQLELEEIIEDQRKRTEIKDSLDEFISLVRDQQDLENRRQKHLEFIFDSEAKAIYDRQCGLWKIEEEARQKLMKDVIETVKRQVEMNLEKNKEKQKEVLKEREENTNKIEQYNAEMEKLKEENEKSKKNRRKILDEDVKEVTNARKKENECFRLKELDDELERIRQEEDRLKKEIMSIQRKQGPVRTHNRSSRFLY